ncbi:MAG: hypothetical protein GEU90_00920 [Gemmatimonas sp.]|nr:hypothetical protein [Gemmatimonas sp.]
MADYERNTVLPISQVLELAEEILTTRAGLQRMKEDHHNATYTGGEGTVGLAAHRHGTMTTVTIRTNQLRTSKVDIVVRHLMNQLPYQPGDPGREY